MIKILLISPCQIPNLFPPPIWSSVAFSHLGSSWCYLRIFSAWAFLNSLFVALFLRVQTILFLCMIIYLFSHTACAGRHILHFRVSLVLGVHWDKHVSRYFPFKYFIWFTMNKKQFWTNFDYSSVVYYCSISFEYF